MAPEADVLNPTTSNLAPESNTPEYSENRTTQLRWSERRTRRQIWRFIRKLWERKAPNWRNSFHLPKHKTFAKDPEANGSTFSSNPPRGSSAPSSLPQSPDSPGFEGGIVPELSKPISCQTCNGSAVAEVTPMPPQTPSVKNWGPNDLAPGQKSVNRHKNICLRNKDSKIIMKRMLLDLGADANLMSEKVQKELGAELKSCNSQVTWGDGERIIHIGEVTVDWYFDGKGVTYTTTFVVVPGRAWFDTLLGHHSINEYNLLVENERVCVVMHANQSGIERGSCDE